MSDKSYGVFVNSRLMVRTITLLKAKRLCAEYIAKGLNASYGEIL